MLRDDSLKGNYLRPRHDINPKQKEKKEYNLNWCRYIYSEYLADKTAIRSQDIDRINRNRSYAEGRQDPEIYKKTFLGDNNDGPPILVTDVDKGTGSMNYAREGWVDMNFNDIFSPLPKYVMNIVGIMEGQDHDIIVEATDENSGAARTELKYSMLVKNQLKDVMAVIQQTFGVQLESDNMPLPRSVEELDLYSNLGTFKLPYEIAQEKVLSFTQHISDNSEIKKQLIIDGITDGFMGSYTYKDSATGLIKYKRLDVTELILEASREKDYRDATFFGIPEYYSVVDFRNENPEVPEIEIETMARTYSGKLGNPNNSNLGRNEDGSYNYDEYKIMVLYCAWKTTDSEYITTRVNQNGEEVSVYEPYRTAKNGKELPPKEYNKDNRKTTRTDMRCLYHAKWVVGTDHVFSYGKMINVPFDYSFKDVPLPVRLYKLAVKPIIESLIPIEDQIEFTYLKLQNDIIKAAPSGIAIEFGSLENIAYGNKKLKPKDVLKVYSQTGYLMYRLTPTMPGQSGSQAIPFQELKGGYGEAVASAVQALDLYYQQLSIISGIDQYSSVSATPSADAGKAVTEIAVAATGNTLKPIYSGYVRIKEQIARILALRIQAEILAVENIEDSPYFKVIGGPLVAAIQSAEDYPPVEWGFKIIAKPTEQLKAEVMAAARQALASGKNGVPLLEYSEYLFLVEHLNSGAGIKYARLFLAHREGQAAKQAQAMSERNIELQGQQNLMLKQVENEKVKAEMGKELQIVNAKKEADLEIERLKHENKMREITLMAGLNKRDKPTE